MTAEEVSKPEPESTWRGRAQGLYQALIDLEGTRGVEHISAHYAGGDPDLEDYVKVFNEGKKWALDHLKNTIISRIHGCGYEPGVNGVMKKNPRISRVVNRDKVE